MRTGHIGRPLIAVLVGVLLALGILEVAARVFPGLVASDSMKREARWRRTHVFLTRTPDNPFAHSPELGWDLKLDYRSERINTNSAGMRGVREYAQEPPPGVKRVLCVGDSFTFGERLADDESMPVQLDEALKGRGRWEVLNLGVPGYGTDQQWLRLQKLGFQYRADVVVLGFFEENIRRNIMSFRDYAKPFFELTGGGLELRNVPVPSPEQLMKLPPGGLDCRLRLGCAVDLIHDGIVFDYQMLDAGRTPAGRVTVAILDAMRRAVLDRGMQFVVMTIPRPIRPSPSRTEDLLVRWAARTGTPLFNLRTAYLGLPETERARLYAGHWTPHGAKVTAQLLAQRLSEGAGPAR